MKNLIESTYSKLNFKEIGSHLLNYTDLYLKPLKVWKKIIGNRKNGYDLLVLHLFYYCFFIFLIIREVSTAISLVLLETIVTVIPFLTFIIPFLFFTKFFKKQYKWNKLFRLYIIIKLQCIPIFIISEIVLSRLKIESFYIFSDNLLWLPVLGFIILFPTIIKLTIKQKLLWIFTNYMFFLVIFSTSYYVFANIKGGTAFINKLQSKQLLISPNAEYQNLRENCFYSSLMIDDSRCIVIMKKDSLNKNKIYKTQIMTYKLDLLFSEADYNQNTRRANLIIDEMNAHIFDAKNTIRESNKIIIDRNDILKKLKWDVKLLDTHVYKGPEKAKKILERDEYKDLSLTILKTHDSLLQKDIQQFHTISRKNYDLAKFESNKEYFGNLSSYLSFYDSLFLDSSNIYREINIDTPEHEILLENNYIAKTYRITSPNINLTKSKLIGLEKEYNLREAKSNFIMNIIFLPIDYLMDISDFDDY